MSLKMKLKILDRPQKNKERMSNVYVSMENVGTDKKHAMEIVIKDGKEIIVKFLLKKKNWKMLIKIKRKI